MNKRILLVFPGLRPHLNEGAKHRLNSYIENYKTQGYIVDVLCFYRDISYIGRLNKYINSNANWHFYPIISYLLTYQSLCLLIIGLYDIF